MKFMIIVVSCAVLAFVKCGPVVLGPCECGVFTTVNITSADIPIMRTKPINVTCDDEGMKSCIQICTALAVYSKARAPIILCDVVGHVVDLKPSVFVSTCGTNSWTYAGLTSNMTYCCHDNIAVPCSALLEE